MLNGINKTAAGFFAADIYVNLILGLLMALVPGRFRDFISAELLSPLIYMSLGAVFLLFGAWQISRLVSGRVSEAGTFRAALAAAALPVIPLSAALIKFSSRIELLPLLMLWAGDIYMLMLGVIYAAALRGKSSRNKNVL